MNEDPFRLKPEHQLYVALAVIIFTGAVQAIVLISNSLYVLQTLGTMLLIIYGAAAICYLLWDWVMVHIDDIKHARLTKSLLLGFCFWIGAEEALHASHHYQTPEIAQAVASVFWSPEDITKGAQVIVVALTLLMIEILSHFQRNGIVLYRSAKKKVCRKKK